ncbi:Fe-S cluster assembly protein SufB, partial [Patescibacteria group bacterium]|nr:Fe-S cluster assembly protein SufB [Patescibacteria group bacterium]
MSSPPTLSSVHNQSNPAAYIDGVQKGVTQELIKHISSDKNEPKWMLEHRIESFEIFNKLNLPKWGPDLSALDLDDIIYYAPLGLEEARDWGEVPEDIRKVYDRLGIPEAEHKWLAGVGAQYESEIIYHSLKEQWKSQGVIFMDMDDAVHEYPDLVKEYFM